MFAAHLAGRRRIRARRTAGYTNKDQKQWSQEALYAEGYYLEAGEGLGDHVNLIVLPAKYAAMSI